MADPSGGRNRPAGAGARRTPALRAAPHPAQPWFDPAGCTVAGAVLPSRLGRTEALGRRVRSRTGRLDERPARHPRPIRREADVGGTTSPGAPAPADRVSACGTGTRLCRSLRPTGRHAVPVCRRRAVPVADARSGTAARTAAGPRVHEHHLRGTEGVRRRPVRAGRSSCPRRHRQAIVERPPLSALAQARASQADRVRPPDAGPDGATGQSPTRRDVGRPGAARRALGSARTRNRHAYPARRTVRRSRPGCPGPDADRAHSRCRSRGCGRWSGGRCLWPGSGRAHRATAIHSVGARVLLPAGPQERASGQSCAASLDGSAGLARVEAHAGNAARLCGEDARPAHALGRVLPWWYARGAQQARPPQATAARSNCAQLSTALDHDDQEDPTLPTWAQD